MLPIAGNDHVQRLSQDLLQFLVLLNSNKAKRLGDPWFEVTGDLAGIGTGHKTWSSAQSRISLPNLATERRTCDQQVRSKYQPRANYGEHRRQGQP